MKYENKFIRSSLIIINSITTFCKEHPEYKEEHLFSFIQLITNKLKYNSFNNKVNLKNAYLEENICDDIKKYRDALINDLKIVKSDKIYIPGKKSFSYWINDDFLKGEIVKHRINYSKKEIKKAKYNKTLINGKNKYYLMAPYKFLQKLYIEERIPMQYINDYEEKFIYNKKYTKDNNESKFKKTQNRIIYANSLDRFENKDLLVNFFGTNKTNGRLDHPLTNMKSEFLKSLIGEFFEADLPNSQFTFSSVLLKDILSNDIDNLPKKALKSFGKVNLKKIKKFNYKDIELFFNDAINGVLYDNFLIKINSLGKKQYTRLEVKDIFFSVGFSSNNENINNFKTIKQKLMFKRIYPEVYEIFCLLKKNGNEVLPIYLQIMESDFFLHKVLKNLVDNNIHDLFTKHDSVICTIKDKDKTLEIIKKTFKDNYGFIPNLHQKYFGIKQ